jgi:hypothetical protein
MGRLSSRCRFGRDSMVGGAASGVVAMASVLAAAPAAAQATSQSALAEALFRSARTLMANGNYAEACPKFAESNRVDPKVGTSMNLALCHEKAGMTASAWAEYTQAVELARRANQSERERVAQDRAKALEPSLAHVIVDADPKADLAVTIDDQPIGAAAYGTPMPVDPGDHVLRATSAGLQPFRESFHVAPGAPDLTLQVPSTKSWQSAESALPAESQPSNPEGAAERPSSKATTPARRSVGFVVGGAGVALAGVGAFFGIRAFSEKDDAAKACGATFCTPAGSAATSAMKTDETLSTIGVLAGAAAFGVGLYLVLATKSSEPGASTPTVRVGIDIPSRGLTARIAW